MKKGISLIVLVITIIVLAIIAGAVIISLSNTNTMEEAHKARELADLANARASVQLTYAAAVAESDDGVAYDEGGDVMSEQDYYEALNAAGWTDSASEFKVTVENGVPTHVATI